MSYLNTVNKFMQELINPNSNVAEASDDDDSSDIPDPITLPHKQHPFNKGVLDFDDFNYANFYFNTKRSVLKNMLGTAHLK